MERGRKEKGGGGRLFVGRVDRLGMMRVRVLVL